jgi:hypothetical protein
MRGRRSIIIGGLFAALVGGQAFAQDLAGSPHDLSSGVAGNEDKNEICVYCHTPHGAQNLVGPLWNKNAGSVVQTSYDSTTIDGDILGVTGSVSVACLSCHDGSQAPDSVVNAPGTGLGDGKIGALTALTGVAAVGADDLVNDHPIGIQYGGFEPTPGNPIDPDFVSPEVATINGAQRWWVETGVTPLVRNKEDLILYTRDNTVNSGASEEPFVECASCHDPHVGAVADAGTNLPGSDISFMRISNENSDVCLACHVK